MNFNQKTIILRTVLLVFLVANFCSCQSEEKTPTSKSHTLPCNIESKAAQDSDEKPIATREQAIEIVDLQDQLLRNIKLTVNNGWKDLPTWLEASDIPFDTRDYFGLAADQNGDQHYLQAFSRASMQNSMLWLPKSIFNNSNQLKPEFDDLYQRSQHFDELRYHLLDWVYDIEDKQAQSYFLEQAPVYIEKLQAGIDELRLAHKLPSVIIAHDFSLDGFNPGFEFRSIAQDLSILYLLSPNSDDALEALNLTLQMERNLRKLGSYTEQITCDSIIEHVVNYQVKAMLNATDDPQRLAAIIEVLELAYKAITASPSYLELARFEHLQLRKLLHELQTNTFKPDPESLKTVSLPADTQPTIAMHKLMTIDVMGGYPVNESLALEIITQSLSNRPEAIEKAKKIIATAGNHPGSFNPAGGIILPKIIQSVVAMNDKDFQFELEILNKRYKQLEAAMQTPFPQRIQELETLSKQWTTDDSWRNTKLLRWYLPQPKVRRFATKAELLIGGTLTLACVTKVKLENGGKLPTNIDEILADNITLANANVVDPFSGAPYKLLAKEAKRIAVYSIGADEHDGNCKAEISPSEFWIGAEGDVVFR